MPCNKRHRSKKELKAIHAKTKYYKVKNGKQQRIAKPRNIDKLLDEGFCVSRVEEKGNKTKIKTYSPKTKSEYKSSRAKFMSYREYNEKQDSLHRQIKEANRKADFAYSNMGRINKEAERKQKRLIEESEKLQKQAEAYDKKNPDWRKR